MKNKPMESVAANTESNRIMQARKAAARLAATIVLHRARSRAAVCADARAFATMPQTDWLTAMEHDLIAWLHQGGFAGYQELPPGVVAATKTAA